MAATAYTYANSSGRVQLNNKSLTKDYMIEEVFIDEVNPGDTYTPKKYRGYTVLFVDATCYLSVFRGVDGWGFTLMCGIPETTLANKTALVKYRYRKV